MASLSLRFALLLASVLTTSVVYSTSYTWTGSAGDNEWTTNNNWNPNTGHPVLSTDTATFSLGAAGANVTISSPISLQTLTVTNSGTAVSFSGSSVTFFGGGITANQGVSSYTLTAPTTVLSGTNTFSCTSSGINMNFSNPITGSGSFTAAGGGIINYAMSSANTYNGQTTVNANTTLNLNTPAGVFAIPGDLTVNLNAKAVAGSNDVITHTSNVRIAGGKLDLTAYTQSPTFTSLDFVANALYASNFPLVLTGAFPLTIGNSTLQTSMQLTSLTGGVVTYDNTNPISLAIISNASSATMTLQGNNPPNNWTFDVPIGFSGSAPGAPDLLIECVIADGGSITNAAKITKTDTGTLQLTGTNTYFGPTVVTGGALSISKDSNLGSNPNLTLGETTTLQATGIGPSLSSTTITLSGTSTGVTFDTNSRVFTIASNMTGSGPITQFNTGTLILSGTNSYTGATNVNGDTLAISSDANIGTSANNPVLNLGEATTLKANSANSTLSSATTINLLGNSTGVTFDTNSNAFSIASAISGSGPFTKINPGTLTLTGSNSYTGGTIVSDGILQGTTDGIQGDVNNNAAVVFDQTTTGTYAGNMDGSGSLTKQNTGTVILSGTNSYSGGTTVSSGTLQGTTDSIQGDITNNAVLVFDQATTGTYANQITGTGSLTKQNTGNLILSNTNTLTGATTVTGGRLSVNGSLTSGGVTVNTGATLGGTGTVAVTGLNVIAIDGTLSPGNSIGTINLAGPVNFGPGSTLEIEITPDPLVRDFVNVTGNVNISGSGTTLLIEPQPGVYPSSFSAEILAATSITGRFATLTSTLPTFTVEADYSSTEIILTTITSLPFSSVVQGGNAGAVAVCLDAMTPASGSDMAFVQAELRMIPTVEGLAQALAMLQPSQFTALALAQEETTLYANGTIFQRLRQNTEICSPPCSTQSQETCKEEKKLGFWVSPFGGFAYQREQRGQVGFNTDTGGVVTGLDYTLAHHWTLGGAVGYSYDHLKWKEGAGYANIQDGYGALYASFVSKYAYALGSMMGSYNHYNTARDIEIGDGLVMPIDRTAKASHNGYQASGHLQAGLLFGKKVQFAPFGEVDYIFVHEANFNERGAKSLDLHVQKKLSDLLQGEAGFEISRCFSMSKNRVSPSIGFSVIQEWRFLGKRYKSNFSGSSCVMHTKGMNPDRTLFSSECGLTFLLPDENQTLSLDYKGKWGEHFQDNCVMAQFLMRF